jgi:type II secretory pathway pseudopilin PulG
MEGSREMQGTVGLGGAALRAAPGHRNRRRRAAGQSGFGLIEVVLAVGLVSLGVLALASAFLTLTRVNAATEAQQRVDHAVANYAESLKAADYVPCATGVDYSTEPGLWAPPAGLQVQIDSVQYWNPAADGGTYQPDCPGTDGGTQLVTVRASSGDAERRAQIVKRQR